MYKYLLLFFVSVLLPLSVQARGKAALAGAYYSPTPVNVDWRVFNEQVTALELQISPGGSVFGHCRISRTVQGQLMAPLRCSIEGSIKRSKKIFLLKAPIWFTTETSDPADGAVDGVLGYWGEITGEFRFTGRSRKPHFHGVLSFMRVEAPVKLFR